MIKVLEFRLASQIFHANGLSRPGSSSPVRHPVIAAWWQHTDPYQGGSKRDLQRRRFDSSGTGPL